MVIGVHVCQKRSSLSAIEAAIYDTLHITGICILQLLITITLSSNCLTITLLSFAHHSLLSHHGLNRVIILPFIKQALCACSSISNPPVSPPPHSLTESTFPSPHPIYPTNNPTSHHSSPPSLKSHSTRHHEEPIPSTHSGYGFPVPTRRNRVNLILAHVRVKLQGSGIVLERRRHIFLL